MWRFILMNEENEIIDFPLHGCASQANNYELSIFYFVFAEHGTVLGVKMLESKGPPPDGPDGNPTFDARLTHFAFVVFDNEDSAKNVIDAFGQNKRQFQSPDGVQLDVAQKDPPKPRFGGSRGGGGGFRGRGGFRGGGGGGYQGGGGGYRGGGGGGGGYQRYDNGDFGGGGGGGYGGRSN